MAEVADQPVALGDGDEPGGRDIAMLGMGPAQQALEAGDFARADIHLRLVMGVELAGLDRLAQILGQRRARLHVLVEPGLEEMHLSPACPLGPIERQVGAP